MAEPIQAVIHPHGGYLYGAVDIAPGVVMAEGVILGAAVGCRLVISTGVCLGADVIVQAVGGDLVIEPGANLGRGVLVTGQGRIGYHVCVGADSTVINPAIGASQVVPPRSLWGDFSRSYPNPAASIPSPPLGPPGSQPGGNSPPIGSPTLPLTPSLTNGRGPVSAPELNGGVGSAQLTSPEPELKPEPEAPVPGSAETIAATNGASVYGKKQVDQLLNTLFPHRQSLNGASSGDKP